MHEHTALTEAPSKVVWENLEQFTRVQVQEFIQRLREEEVFELLGRAKSERRPSEAAETQAAPSAAPVYRNGYGKPRRLSTAWGTVTVQRPRVRGLEGRFESRALPLFQRRTRAVDRLLPELYLHGLAEGDFDQALRGFLGEQAPVSAASISRLKAGWQQEYRTWKERSLADCEVVYLWVGCPLGGASTSRPGSRRTKRRCWWCWVRCATGAKSCWRWRAVTGRVPRAGPPCCAT